MLISLDMIIKKYDMKINGVFHIGAHYGQESECYNKQNILDVVYFEPQKHVFEILKQKVKNGKFFNLALGDKKSHMQMFVEHANQGMSSSLLRPALHTKQYPQIIFNDSEVVEVDTLDNVSVEHNISNKINMINMDVQGFELSVLKGATETLKQIDYIYTEVNRADLYENCSKVEQLDEFLSGFTRVETEWVGNTWGDALYIKKSWIK
jgi:FkbM family methyltransferase